MQRWVRTGAWIGGLIIAGWLLIGCRPIDVDLVVNRAADGADLVPGDGVCEVSAGAGDCSLRAAIDETNATPERDRITILPETDPSLGAAPAPITADLVIEGGGAVLHERLHHDGGTLELHDLTIEGVTATDGCGAGIESLGGSLELVRVRVVDNRHEGPDGSRGGGVCAEGSLVVRDSTIAGNQVTAGADGTGGGIWAGSSLTIVSSTVSGNSVASTTGGAGAGITVDGTGTLAIGLSTVTGNTVAGGASAIAAPDATGLISSSTIAGGGGGPAVALNGDLVLAGTILTSEDAVCGPSGQPSSGGHNLAADASCALSDPSDAVGDALLGALGDHGGTTATRVPGPGSPALDAIVTETASFCDGTVPADQRGSVRPFGAGCDIGAVERRLELHVDSALDLVDAVPGDGSCAAATGECTLRAAIGESNASGGDGLVTIEPGVDPVIAIPGRFDDANLTGDLDITAPITIDGGGATVDGADLDRVFELRTGRLIIRDLTITGGAALTDYSLVDPNGGGILAQGDVVLESVSLVGNAALKFDNPFIPIVGDGSAVSVAGDLEVRDSYVAHNEGSVALRQSGNLVIDRSLFESNPSAIFGNGPTGDISNSTFVSNGVELAPGTVTTIRSSTFVGAGALIKAPSATISGSILSSLGRACGGAALISGGHNVANDDSCSLAAPTDREGVDPRLGALAANGGPTRTMLPAGDSPAVDLIPPGTPGLCESGATDQRGFGRPVGSGCDSGAVEGGGLPSGPALDFVVDTSVDELDADPGDGVCATAAGECSLRAAVVETSLRPTDDRITLATSVVLDRAGNAEDDGLTGDLDVVGNLRIEGGGHEISMVADDRVIDSRGGLLTLVDVVVRGGDATSPAAGSSGADGGGVFAAQGLVLERSEVRDSSAVGRGGGVGAIELTVIDSTIAGNVAGADGGGVWSIDASILRSTLSANASSGKGGGAFVSNVATVTESTIDTNFAPATTPQAQPFGGGLYVVAGPTTLTNVTISDNLGGGLATGFEPATIRATTIAGNSVVGIRFGGGSTTMGATVIAGLGSACSFYDSPPTSVGGNVVHDTSCALAGPGDQQSVSPLLAALADQGGPTATRLPAANSPAVDAIAVGTVGLCDGSIPTDQRGVTRPAGAACDAGAVEGTGPAVDPLALTVDDAADGVDVAIGDGICATDAGTCSLRAAVQETNARPTADTITIATGIDPVLSLAGADEDQAATGDLDVRGQLSLFGNGATVDAAHLDRAFDLAGGPVTITDLVVTDGYVTSADGGAIRSTGATLLLERTDLVGNEAWRGGALWSGRATVVRSGTVADNLAVSSGGGVAVQGELRIEQSLIEGNTAGGFGGGAVATTLIVEGSTIRANAASGGGGLHGEPVTVTDSLVAENHATESGGGIETSVLTLNRSTVRDNTATLNGGGIGSWGGAQAIVVTASTISGNSAGRSGGAIYGNDRIAVTNATISDNTAGVTGGALYLSSYDRTGRITFTTIVGNGGAGHELDVTVGVLFTANVISGSPTACRGALTTGGANVTTGGTCGLTSAFDSIVADVGLGPLADNGGPTWTHLPDPASVAIDRVPIGIAGLCDGSIPADQRGSVRTPGTRCDAGSVER